MHTPVFLSEVLKIFDPQPGQTYVDATVNGGGHARAIADRVGERGRVIGIDLDPDLIAQLQRRNEEEGRRNIDLSQGSYADLDAILGRLGCKNIDGILFDLGFSSYHVDESGRGFSFRRDEPLDMRYDPIRNDLTAEYIVNTWSERAIADILRAWGEERYAGRIAARMVAGRRDSRIATTAELARIVRESIPVGARRSARIDPATRTFQALRMAVNDELHTIERGIGQAVRMLQVHGILVVISFHSLEDRLIKNFFQKQRMAGVLEILTPKPLKPSIAEIRVNPRARSAKLRAARKTS